MCEDGGNLYCSLETSCWSGILREESVSRRKVVFWVKGYRGIK